MKIAGGREKMPRTFNGETDLSSTADRKTDEGHDGFNQNIKEKKKIERIRRQSEANLKTIQNVSGKRIR